MQQMYFFPSGREDGSAARYRHPAYPPGVYPFMHARSRVRCDSDARSRAGDFFSSATSRRDPGLEPDSCPALEARATILASCSSWRLATRVLTASPGRSTCVEGEESILRGITAGGIGLWRAGIRRTGDNSDRRRAADASPRLSSG